MKRSRRALGGPPSPSDELAAVPTLQSASGPNLPERGVLATRPDLAREAESLVQASAADATHKAHAADWKIFREWSAQNGNPRTLPASPETMVAFLTEMARTKATATILRYMASISKGHKIAGLSSPCADERVRAIRAGIVRKKGSRNPNAKDALTPSMVVRSIPMSSDAFQAASDIRDRAILYTALYGALRRSEVCGVRIEQLDWKEQGVLIPIERSKTDQTGEGAFIAIPKKDDDPGLCPVKALREWIALVNEDSGPLFRGLKRNGKPRKTALTEGAFAKIVKKTAEKCGLDMKKFGAHSSRIGYVTEARRAGFSWETIMEQTRHKQISTVKKYSRFVVDPFRATKVADVFSASFRGPVNAKSADVVRIVDMSDDNEDMKENL